LNETNPSNNQAVPTYPSWVPAAVKWQAEQLYAELATHPEPAKYKEILDRLASDPLMENVWREFFRKHRQSQEFFNPAMTADRLAAKKRLLATELRRKAGPTCERDANLLEAEAVLLEEEGDGPLASVDWSAQQRAAQLFLRQAFLVAVENKPVYLRDLQAEVATLNDIAQRSKKDADALELLGMTRKARSLRKIAKSCEAKASTTLSNPRDPDVPWESQSIFEPRRDDPWVLARQSSNDELRAFLVDLAIPTIGLFGKPLVGTLANVAKVIFQRKDITREMAREMLRTFEVPQAE